MVRSQLAAATESVFALRTYTGVPLAPPQRSHHLKLRSVRRAPVQSLSRQCLPLRTRRPARQDEIVDFADLAIPMQRRLSAIPNPRGENATYDVQQSPLPAANG
eukprot:7563800-Pyramimonas_sp.AAC.1